MTTLQINHKKNELFEVEFYKDKECTEAFDFMDKKDLYIELKDGDCTPLLYLTNKFYLNGRGGTYGRNLFIPYLPQSYDILNGLNSALYLQYENIYHIGGYSVLKPITAITPNLSKYIPEDNAVLFLSEEDCDKYCECVDTYFVYPQGLLPRVVNSEMDIRDYKKLTIFLPHGTQSELQKANEVKKELMEKYGVEEVKLFALHCFVKYDVLHYEILNIDESDYFSKTPKEAFEYIQNTLDCDDDDFVEKYTKEYDDEFRKDFEEKKALFFKSLPFNKIITTNSTGILKPEDSNERLQVIDCKEIVEEYLKTQR